MANYKTNRKQKGIYLSKEALKSYDELQALGIRVALLIENFIIEMNKERIKKEPVENEK